MSNTAQRNFSSGELAPSLWGRTDTARYYAGLRTCRNFMVLKSGGAENRPGSELVGAVAGNSVTRLIPFVFNESQAYALEFTDHLVRFIRDGGYIGGSIPYSVSTPYAAADLAGLRYVQSADVLTLVHPLYPPATLNRLAEASWTFTNPTFAPGISAPTGLDIHPSTMGGAVNPVYGFVVTAVDSVTGQESYPSSHVSYVSDGNTNRTLTWNAVAGASEYNLYKSQSMIGSLVTDYGFIGSTGTTTFFDNTITPDILNRAPVPRNPFAGAGNYPTAVSYYQGRLIFGGSLNNPQTVYTSRSADYYNFTVSSPSQDDDALTFALQSRKVSTIQHLHTTDTLLPFTTGGEWIVRGDSSGVLRPTDINALNYAEHGCSSVAPLQIDSRILYVQSRQSLIRDLKRDYYYGYLGADLTILSTHLFNGHQIVDWAYQESPQSIVWCVRDDGILLGLTDVADQQMLAWHRHDTLGTYENVCAVPEGDIDALYCVVNRRGVRYVERFVPRFFEDVQDCAFMDASLSYDGRNANASLALTLTGGTNWTYDEPLTLNASGAVFSAGDVGNVYALTGSDGTVIRLTVQTFSSSIVVTGIPQQTVPVSMRGIPTTTWSRAVDQVGGLDHLEGQSVAVFADGYVVASPNNPAITPVVVTGGIATLDRPYSYIHVGLPFVSDLETLAIDSPQGGSIQVKKTLINQLTLIVASSRGVFAGQNAPPDDGTAGLVEFKQRNQEPYNVPVSLLTGTIQMNIPTAWDVNGHVFVRQVDPIPMSILSVVPTGNIPSP